MNARFRHGLVVMGLSLLAHKYYWLFAMDLSTIATGAVDQQKELLSTTTNTAVPQKTTLHLPEVVKRSLHIPNDSSNITAAVCHKSLFGDIDLWLILDWVAYHRLLGFDRIFISYLPEVRNLDGFAELESLPYVTLFENTEATVTVINDKGYQRLNVKQTLNETKLAADGCIVTGKVPTAQLLLEARCLDQDAHDFDWVLLADADEYLRFKDQIGVKEFLERNQQYDYLSFGKWMYTMKHRTNATTTGFNLENYPFTPGNFCTMQSRTGKPLHKCARKNGRAKVMVKPKLHHGHVCVHGTHIPRKRIGSTQLSVHTAHIMEWNSATMHAPEQPVQRQPEDFVLRNASEANIHGFGVYPKNQDGSVTFRYEERLDGWMKFVANRGMVNAILD